VKKYFINILLGADRQMNAIFGGDSKELISTRVMRYKDKNSIAMLVYRILGAIDYNHCEDSMKYDYSTDHTSDEVLK